MKLTLSTKGPANRKEALACLTANIALPGSGSLAAGKSIGYVQLAVAFVGFIITVIAGGHLLLWMMENGMSVNQQNGDPFQALITVWQEIQWPLVGLCVFGVAWLWGIVTSLQILAAHPKNPVPPRIG